MYVFLNVWFYCRKINVSVVCVEYCLRIKEEWNIVVIKKDCGRLVGGKGCMEVKYYCLIN